MSSTAVVLLGAAVAACAAVALLAWHASHPVVAETFPPMNNLMPCTACTDVDCPVCKDGRRWRNLCLAACGGAFDARPCADTAASQCPGGGSGQCASDNLAPTKCYDSPLGVAGDYDCGSIDLGYDASKARECTRGDIDAWNARVHADFARPPRSFS